MLSLTSRVLRPTHIVAGSNRISPALHPLAIQKSGTGKSPAFDYARMVAEMANISFRSQTDLTAAGLIGTVEDGEPDPGVAANTEIVGFEEMSTLFRLMKRDHSSNLGEHLNQIMDNKRVKKDLAHGTVSYKPKCTLFGTTYPPEDLDLRRLFDNGTLARFFYFFKDIGRGFYKDTLDDVVGSIVSDDSEAELSIDDRTNKIGRLGTTLQAIRAHYDTGFEFDFGFDRDDVRVRERMWDIYEGYPEIIREAVEPAIIRYGVHAMRLSVIMAALDRCAETVTLDHLDQAMEILEESWGQMLDYYSQNYSTEYEELDRTDETRFKILKALMNEGSLTQSELAEAVGKSTRTIRKRTDTLVMTDLIVERGGNGTTKTYELAG